MDIAQEFGIRLADNADKRERARILVERMYGWRGYSTGQRDADRANCATYTASEGAEVLGTATLCIDADRGLNADEVFGDILSDMRSHGAVLCEICRLAFQGSSASKTVFGALVHVLFIYAHHLNQCTDVVIQINPRHRAYYERMLGFRTLCAVRHNTRANAPALLLHLNLNEMCLKIRRFGGTASHNQRAESLYPYFFSPKQEAGILRRLAAESTKSEKTEDN